LSADARIDVAADRRSSEVDACIEIENRFFSFTVPSST
jgi:hypothetical protein